MSSTYGQIDGFKGRRIRLSSAFVPVRGTLSVLSMFVWIWAGATRAQVSGEAPGGLP